jgi:opacity protein-like surface antigen
MRKVLAVLSAFALATTVASASGIGFFGSYWDAGDFGDGYGGGVKFKANVAGMIGLELRASYLPSFDPPDETSDGATWQFQDAKVIPVEADIVLQFPLDVLTIYGGGGVGYYYIPEFESKVVSGSSLEPDIDPNDVFGGFAVGGVEFALGENLAIFMEAVYRWVEIDKVTVDDEEIDLSGGDTLDLSGVGVNGGVMLTF